MSVQANAHYFGMEESNFNPRLNITKEHLARKKKERASWAKKTANHIPDEVYGMYYFDLGEKLYFYVGITNNLERRFNDHINGISDITNQKAAYVFARNLLSKGLSYHFEHLGPAASFTEEEWLAALKADGHPMMNEGTVVGNRRNKKQRK